MAEPTLTQQLAAVSRMALNLNTSIASMCDVIEGQAKEIERLTALIPPAVTPQKPE